MSGRSRRERLDATHPAPAGGATPAADVEYAPAVGAGVLRWVVGAFAVAIGAAIALALAHGGGGRPSAVERARRGPAIGIVPPERAATPPAPAAAPPDGSRRTP